MKAAVFSDTHSNTALMLEAVRRCRPDAVIHLGDYERDTEALKREFPDIPLFNVCGNCDMFPSAPLVDTVQLGPVKALICHGHTYGVKQSLLSAGFAAEEQNLDLFLFGHTHRPLVDMRGKTLFLNPGSIGDYHRPFYGIVTILNGRLDGRPVPLD